MTAPDQKRPSDYHAVRSTGEVKTAIAGENVRSNEGTEQHFYGNVAIVSENGERQRQRHQRLSHSADQRNYLRKRFIEPSGFSQATEELARTGTVFLSGPPGSGRQSSAKMLLWNHFSGIERHYRRIPLDEEEDETPLDLKSVQHNELLLLDLSIEDLSRSNTVVRMLDTFRRAVETQQAALVIVLPTEWEDQLGTEFTRPRVEIKPPPGESVLRAHLRAGGLSPPGQLGGDLAAYVSASPVRDLEHMGDRIVQAANTSPNGTFENWATEASRAVSDHSRVVADLVRSCHPEQRALLLSAAMLEKAHTDAAYTAHAMLLTNLDFPKDERHVLERAGLDEVMRTVKVEPSLSREIRFSAPRYAEAVREYFWTNHPELRDDLRVWVADVINQHELTDDDRHRLVARFATQACRTGRVDDLCILAAQWTKERTHRTSPFAASALAYGLRDHTHAWKVRRQIYEWSRPDQRVELASVLVAVCADVMADTHPERALVRLRKLAGHRDADVARSARNALRDLTENNRFYRRFLWRMVGWIEHPKSADIALFFAVSRAHRLLDSDTQSPPLIRSATVQDQLTACWRAVFRFNDTVWHDAARDCFTGAAASSDGYRLLDILVAATDRERSQLAKLHVIARDWATQSWLAENPVGADRAASPPTDQPRTPHGVCRQLAVRIDRAQNLLLQHEEEPC